MITCSWHDSYVKGKGGPMLFNWTTRHEGVLGSVGIAPRILDLATRWRWVVSFSPARFTPRERWVVSFSPARFTPRERAPGTHWIGCTGASYLVLTFLYCIFVLISVVDLKLIAVHQYTHTHTHTHYLSPPPNWPSICMYFTKALHF